MATSIFDYASLVWDGRLSGYAPGKLFPLKPNVKDLTGDFFTVTRAGTGYYFDKDGLYKLAAANVPRIEYNTDGTYRGLLVEPGATNLLLRSQEFDSGTWPKNATGINTAVGTSGIDPNVAIAPDGTMTADRVNFLNQADPDVGLNQSVATSVSTAYTNSIFVKGEGADIGKQIRVRIRRNTGTTNTVQTTITLTADWQRVSTNYTTLADNTNIQIVYSSAVGGAVTALIWQAQLETGSVATSPIVTTAGTASRVADVVSLTGASSLIGQTEGTIFVDVIPVQAGATRAIISLDDDNGTSVFNRYQLAISTSGTRRFQVVSNNVDQANIQPAGNVDGLNWKIAVCYKLDDFAMYYNGVSVGTDTSGVLPLGTISRVHIGNIANATQPAIMHIRSVALFPTRLSNATLASLTA